MTYGNLFRQKLDALRQEGRYRVFAELERFAGDYPNARRHAGEGTHDVTVWCSNNYMGMGQDKTVIEAMKAALEKYGTGAGGTGGAGGQGGAGGSGTPVGQPGANGAAGKST